MVKDKTKTTSKTPSKVSSGSVLSRITKPQAGVSSFLVVVYARTGVGKTTLLKTMPGRGLVIDIPQFEGGTEVLADAADRIDVVPVVDWDEIDVLYHFLRGKHEYDWVAVDTITAMQRIARKKVINERDSVVSQPYQIRMQDWGSMGQLMDIFFAQFRTLPIPVIMLAQEKTRESADDSTMSITGPSISPASLDALVPHPKLLGRLFVYQNERTGRWQRRLRVGVHSEYYAKARTVTGRELPDVIRQPNLGQILDYMMEKEVEKPKGAKEESGLLL